MDIIKDAGEASFASIGLGGWSPVGIVQQILELVHIDYGLPWWGTIALGTICVRTLMLPLVVLSQRNAAKMHNTLPGMQKIQERITEARNCGDNMEGKLNLNIYLLLNNYNNNNFIFLFIAARATQELLCYMKSNDCNPMKNMIVPLCQVNKNYHLFFFIYKII